MAIVAVDSGANFLPAPAGTHQAVCVDVIDEGMQPGFEGAKPVHKISIVWQIPEENPETQRRFEIRKWYTLSLNEKSNLSKDMESWFGKAFTELQRTAGWDVEQVIGYNCQMSIIHKLQDSGKVRATITAIMGLPKGVPPLVAMDYVRKQDRESR